MRSILLTVLLCLTTAAAAYTQVPPVKKLAPVTSNATTYVRPDKKERVNRYIKGMFGLGAIGKNIAGAGISTWTDSPKEWGPHWSGFGKRFASNMGKGFIRHTVAFGLEEAFGLDSQYYRSTKRDFASKFKNALISTFTARDKKGKTVFGFPRIVGTYTASLVAVNTWYPRRFGWKDGLRSGSVSLGASALFNLIKEFIHTKK